MSNFVSTFPGKSVREGDRMGALWGHQDIRQEGHRQADTERWGNRHIDKKTIKLIAREREREREKERESERE